MKRKLLSLAVCAALVISVLSSCSAVSSESDVKVFRYAVNNIPTSLDPSRCNGITDNEFTHAITEGLTRTTGGVVSPGIAESWDVSSDGRIYTFHLRDANWSDGVPITAGDFVYSWKRLLDPATGSEYAFAAWMIRNAKKINLEGADPDTLGVRAIDDKTLQVELDNPTAYFLSYIGSQPHFAPIRRDYVEKYGDEFALTPEKNVYSGPFVLKDAGGEDGTTWVFEKNPQFWDAEHIRIDRTEAVYTYNDDDQISLFEDGKLNFAYVPNHLVTEYKDRSNVNHFLSGTVDYCYINTECSNIALKNRDFRLALNYALNRKLYNHNANDDAYMPYNGLIFPGLNGRDGVTYGEYYYVDSYSFPMEGDVDTAREYLGKAMNEIGVGSPDEISVKITAPDSGENSRVLNELKAQWEKVLGINVIISLEDRTEIYSEIYPSGNYEIGLSGWVPDYNDPYTYLELWRSDNTSYTPYSNPDLDALLDAAYTESDHDKRMDMLNKAEILLLEDAPIVPLEAKDKYYMLDPRVSDLTLSYCNITVDWAYAGVSD